MVLLVDLALGAFVLAATFFLVSVGIKLLRDDSKKSK